MTTLDPTTTDVEPFAHGVASTEPIVFTGGVSVRILATAAETGGSMGMLVNTYPCGSGFPMHIHHKEDEVIVLLEGRLLCEAGDRQFELSPGEVLFGPRNVPHGFVSVGDVPARFVELFLPGGLEEVFRSPDELKAYIRAGRTAERYDLEVVGGMPAETRPRGGS